MKRSTGLRNRILSGSSVKDALAGKVIKWYSGPEPATADSPLSGNTLLLTNTVNGDGTTGLTMAAVASGGQLTKNPSEVWEGEIIASGTATFFRMEGAADSGAASTTLERLQGSIGLAQSDLNTFSTSLLVGNTRRINTFVVSIPAG